MMINAMFRLCYYSLTQRCEKILTIQFQYHFLSTVFIIWCSIPYEFKQVEIPILSEYSIATSFGLFTSFIFLCVHRCSMKLGIIPSCFYLQAIICCYAYPYS